MHSKPHILEYIFLKEWTWAKQVERWFKVVVKGADPEGLSACEPETYLERFQVVS
jgi:hypothetical protein